MNALTRRALEQTPPDACIRATQPRHTAGRMGLLLMGAPAAEALGLGSVPCWLCAPCYAELMLKTHVGELTEVLSDRTICPQVDQVPRRIERAKREYIKV